MIDEMPNPTLIEYVLASEDSTETERELAERLQYATAEVDRLTATVRHLEAVNGADP